MRRGWEIEGVKWRGKEEKEVEEGGWVKWNGTIDRRTKLRHGRN